MHRSWWVLIGLVALSSGCPYYDDCGKCTSADTGRFTTLPCAGLAVDACAARADCAVINGRPLTWPDTASACYEAGDPEPVGCMDAGLDCPADIKFQQSPDGVCYELGGCVPEGFVDCSFQGTVTECP